MDRYFGKVCERHPELGGARTAGRHCPACNRERVKQWQQDNLDHVNAYRRRRYAADPSKRQAVNERWRRANLPRRAKILAAYRARRADASPPLLAAEQERVQALYAKAARITRETGVKHHVDHDRPLALGGKHHPDNLLVVPAAVNTAKGARYASTLDFLLS